MTRTKRPQINARPPQTIVESAAPSCRPFAAPGAAAQERPAGSQSMRRSAHDFSQVGVLHNSAPMIQPKLVVTPARDQYEQEADRVAAEVVRQISAPSVAQLDQGQVVQRRAITPLVQRSADRSGAISSDLERAIQRTRAGGSPLAASVRAPMEQAFGHNFAHVRVHAGSEADALNRSVSARAFTTGQDIFFRRGEYSPGSQAGQQLLAHELTHVVQQGGGAAIQRLAIHDDPINWNQVLHLSGSGEGLTGVLFAADDAAGQHKRLVIKPLDNPAQVLFGQDVLAEAGVRTPTSKVINLKDNTPPGVAVKAMVQRFQQGSAPQLLAAQQAWAANENNRQLEKAYKSALAKDRLIRSVLTEYKYVLVQEFIGAVSMHDAPNQEGTMQQLQQALTNVAFLQQIGAVFAADAFTGNPDRLNKTDSLAKANLGNIMIAINAGQPQLVAIDNEAVLQRIDQAASVQKWAEIATQGGRVQQGVDEFSVTSARPLGDPATYATTAANQIRAELLRNHAHTPNYMQDIDTHVDWDMVASQIGTGMVQAWNRLSAAMNAHRIKQQLRQREGQFGPGLDYASLKAKRQYADLRRGAPLGAAPATHEAATAQVTQYGQRRQDRSNMAGDLAALLTVAPATVAVPAPGKTGILASSREKAERGVFVGRLRAVTAEMQGRAARLREYSVRVVQWNAPIATGGPEAAELRKRLKALVAVLQRGDIDNQLIAPFRTAMTQFMGHMPEQNDCRPDREAITKAYEEFKNTARDLPVIVNNARQKAGL